MQGKLTLGFIHPFQLWGLNLTLNIFPSFSKAACNNCTCDHKLWGPLAPICSGLLPNQASEHSAHLVYAAGAKSCFREEENQALGRKEI